MEYSYTVDISTHVYGDRPYPLSDIAKLLRHLDEINNVYNEIILSLVEILTESLPLNSKYEQTGEYSDHSGLLFSLLDFYDQQEEKVITCYNNYRSLRLPDDFVTFITDISLRPQTLLEFALIQGEVLDQDNFDLIFNQEVKSWKKRFEVIRRNAEADLFIGGNIIRNLEGSYNEWRKIVLLLQPPFKQNTYRFLYNRECILDNLDQEIAEIREIKSAYDS